MALVVVAYDIAHDRRRAKMHSLLLGYGQPVQRSVFECELDDDALDRLRRRVVALVRAGDLVRLYPLCQTCASAVIDSSGRPRPREPVAFFPQ